MADYKQKMLDGYYSDHSEEYDSIMTRYFGRVSNKTLIDKLDFKHGDKILDAGSGTGNNLKFLPYYNTDLNVTAMDRSLDMMAVAKKKVPPSVDFVSGDLRNMSFSDDTFDVTIFTYVLSGCSDCYSAFKEITRVTKKGGTLGILDFHHGPSAPIGGFGGANIKEILELNKEFVEISEHAHYERYKSDWANKLIANPVFNAMFGNLSQDLYILKIK